LFILKRASPKGRLDFGGLTVMKRLLIGIVTLLCVALLALAAPPDGTWNNTSPASGGPATLVLQANGKALGGTADGQAIAAGKTEGVSIWFTAVRGGTTYSYKGSVNGNVLKLAETHMDGSGLKNLTYLHQ
jgi:hypothetical protein